VTKTFRRVFIALLLWTVAYPGVVFVAMELDAPPAAEARSGGSGGGFSRSSGGSSSGGSSSSGGGSSSSGGSSGGGEIFAHIFVACAEAVWNTMTPDQRRTARTVGLTSLVVFVVLLFVIRAIRRARRERAAQRERERNSVVRLQVALNALRTKGLRATIEQRVRTADLVSSEGLGALAHQVCQDLLDHKDHIEFAHVLAEERLEDAPAEARFNTLAAEARAFFDREVIRRDARGVLETTRNSSKSNELFDEDGSFGVDEFFVVTLVVCVEEIDLELLRGDGAAFDVPNAATSLTSIYPRRFAGCEVVWTPAAESDILTRDEVLAEFPQLAPVTAGAL
jgi:uncharacterized membrane protein